MDSSAIALLGFAIVGTVELFKRLFDKDFRSATIIAGAAIVGAVGGHFLGIPAIQGLIIGLEGSGLVTVGTKIGGN